MSELARGLTINGPPGTAVIAWGAQIAARLGKWALDHGVLTADLEDAHPLRLTQPGLTFMVDRPNGHPWTWPVRELHVSDTSITATLGPKEPM